MEQKEKIFASGIRFERPADGSPDFIKGKISIKVPEFIPFLEKNVSKSGWVNIDLKKSTKGNLYLELNTWKPKNEVEQEREPTIDPVTGVDTNDIPF